MDEALRLRFRGAVLASIRGVGPARRAEAFTLESLAEAVHLEEPVVSCGPCAGRASIVGTWWLLKEIEAGLLRYQVRGDGHTLAAGPQRDQKTDSADRGRSRAQRRICQARRRPRARLLPQGCRFTRSAQGAGAHGLLFVDKGGVVIKEAAPDTLQTLVAAEPGRISGHFMRRSGVQIRSGRRSVACPVVR